jgi:25S rRNA (adenine2142-N1)-methyltransferase
MPKARKRKAPVTGTNINAGATTSRATTSGVIRRFHVLIKRRAQLVGSQSTGDHDARTTRISELEQVEGEIEELGGLEEYQRMSTIGQGHDRGGGSDRIFVGLLVELGYGPSNTKRNEGDVERLRCVFTSLKTRQHLVYDIGSSR